jgi:hypothetical protein
VLEIIIGISDILFKNHKNPAKGITASLGTGAIMLSKVIKKNMPV